MSCCKKSVFKIICVFLAVFIAIFAVMPVIDVMAADKPAVKFYGEYSSLRKTLKVTVSVKTGSTAVQSGMFVIEYDSSYLTSAEENPTVTGDAVAAEKSNDRNNDRVVLEWYYDKALPSAEEYVDVAQMDFSVKSGGISDINNMIWLCTDVDYLERIGGYGNDGGLLLCYGKNDYSVSGGKVDVVWEMVSTTKIERIGGSDRYETASRIAQTAWPDGADNVILASGIDYADALAGVPVSEALDAPILLVNGTELSTAVTGRLAALSPKKVYILGGTSAVSQSIEDSVKSMGYAIERISGADRFETSVKIAGKLESLTGTPASKAFFAYGFNYPDALSAGTVAALTHTPILYAPSSGAISQVVKSYIESSKITSAVVLGGTNAIGNSTLDSIKSAGAVSVERVSGEDRYATSLAIVKKYNSIFKSEDISIATGEEFPDALAGGALAAKKGIPVILVGSQMNSSDIRGYISGKSCNNVYIFGGTAAVPQKYIDSIIA